LKEVRNLSKWIVYTLWTFKLHLGNVLRACYCTILYCSLDVKQR